MGGRVSIKEVAKRAGVSTATVSNVFSGKKPVNDDLAERVRKVAKDLGYQVNKAASLLRSGKNSVVAVLVPDLSDPFFTSVIKCLEKLAGSDGYEIIVGSSADDVQIERGRLDALLAWQPAGLVVIPCSDQVPLKLSEPDAPPFVLADRVADFGGPNTVTIDNFRAGEIAARFLGDNGHKNILIAASNLAHAPIRERLRGAESIAVAFGGRTSRIELGNEPDTGAAILSRWLGRNHLPSAVFATNDMSTLAVLACLAERRIDMPKQVSVVGFDDYPWMKARKHGITVIRQPVEAIARRVWENLSGQIRGVKPASAGDVLECSLVVRDSVVRIGSSQVDAFEINEGQSAQVLRLERGRDRKEGL